MANPIWITYRESTHGVNSNGYADVSNRPARTIWANFCVEHDKAGTHKSDMTTDPLIWQMEAGTYAGDGTDNRQISLTNTNLDVKFVRIFSASYDYTWFAFANFPYDTAICTEGHSAADTIQTMGVGFFEIGSDNEVNENGVTFYYIVYGEQAV